MNFFQLVVLSVIQGAAELLPVSSSAHVIVAQKLMGLDPTSPSMTFLLVMLHTGTMFAVLIYFWPRWRARIADVFHSYKDYAKLLVIATFWTGVVGLVLKEVIEKIFLHDRAHAEVEMIFGSLPLIGAALFAVGVWILFAGIQQQGKTSFDERELDKRRASFIGAVQGLCLPFRGFSRSGATISAGLMLNVPKALSEDFSFALAVILTPPVIVRETWRLLKASHGQSVQLVHGQLFLPGIIGMFFSFVAGLGALHWLSRWVEGGRWKYFGYYCLVASFVVFAIYYHGV